MLDGCLVIDIFCSTTALVFFSSCIKRTCENTPPAPTGIGIKFGYPLAAALLALAHTTNAPLISHTHAHATTHTLTHSHAHCARKSAHAHTAVAHADSSS